MERIVNAIYRAGGKVYLVGGAVRDMLRGAEPKDYDYLVTGISERELRDALVDAKTEWEEHGAAFKVFRLKGENIELALPRTEISTGPKHTDFEVYTGRELTVNDDLSRRDFTVNAMAQEYGYLDLIDPFGGRNDLDRRILRTVGVPEERFQEDPLRILRAFQFATRFGLEIDEDTLIGIDNSIKLLQYVTGERIMEEFKKVWKIENQQAVRRFYKFLQNSGVDVLLFGNDFKPLTVVDTKRPRILSENERFRGDDEDKINANFMMCFLNGGNSSKLKPSNEMMEYLACATEIRWGKKPVNWKFFCSINAKKILPLVEHVFRINNWEEECALANELMENPISPKELAVTGEELLNMWYQGKQIGQIQKAWLDAIWSGKLTNTKFELLKYLAQNKQMIIY